MVINEIKRSNPSSVLSKKNASIENKGNKSRQQKQKTEEGVNEFSPRSLSGVCVIITQQAEAWMCDSGPQTRPRVPRAWLMNSPPETAQMGQHVEPESSNPLWMFWRDPRAAYFISR